MSEVKKLNSIYKNILGDTKATIDAIQKYIAQSKVEEVNNIEIEEAPADSVNRILNSVASEEISKDINKIIESL
jgi:hypothetical protein